MVNKKARDYKNEYARRKLAAIAKGYSSPKGIEKERNERLGRLRNHAEEYKRRVEIAKNFGFRNVKERQEFNKAVKTGKPLDRLEFQKRKILQFFGISEKRFNEIRKENQQYHQEWGLLNRPSIYIYDEGKDFDLDNWSEERVGYILAYNSAVVNSKTNFWSNQTKYKRVKDANGKWRYIKEFERRNGKIITKANQYWYLVKYAQLMDAAEFGERYGLSSGVSILNRALAKAPKDLQVEKLG